MRLDYPKIPARQHNLYWHNQQVVVTLKHCELLRIPIPILWRIRHMVEGVVTRVNKIAARILERLMTRMAVALMVAVAWGVVDTPQQTDFDKAIQTVPEGETVHMTLSVSRPLWDLPTVLSNSDAVIEGKVTNARAEVTNLPYQVSTRLVIVVDEVWFDRRAQSPTAAATLEPATAGVTTDRIVVLQPGGRLEYSGRFIEVQDSGFPILPVGSNVVLFLNKSASGLMEIVDGPHGAFVKEGQSIRSLLPPGHELRGSYDGLDRATLKLMVEKALAEVR
jgi:hypothetical protein